MPSLLPLTELVLLPMMPVILFQGTFAVRMDLRAFPVDSQMVRSAPLLVFV